MNNFMLDEMVNEEYGRDRIAEAEAYNRYIAPNRKSFAVRFYTALAKLGEWLEGTGAQIHNYFECLAHNQITTSK